MKGIKEQSCTPLACRSMWQLEKDLIVFRKPRNPCSLLLFMLSKSLVLMLTRHPHKLFSMCQRLDDDGGGVQVQQGQPGTTAWFIRCARTTRILGARALCGTGTGEMERRCQSQTQPIGRRCISHVSLGATVS